MTAILGRDDFFAARRREGEAAIQAAKGDRDKALAALLEARADFAADTDAAYVSGARLAARDSDGLEHIASRLLVIVDDLEGAFDRLDPARDVSTAPCQRRRSRWGRADLALGLGEALQPLLSPAAGSVLAAAIRLEAWG